MDQLLFVLNLIGTVAFAISGCIVGIRKKMDLLGCTILGISTAVGGGIIRDIVLGRVPPSAFVNPLSAEIAAAVSVLLFGVIYFFNDGYEKINSKTFQNILAVADTLGLAAFTIIGVQSAENLGEQRNAFFTVFLATITGVGGGMIRDVLANEKPYVLYKHIYAVACIVGALITILLWDLTGELIAVSVGMVSICLLRYLSARFEWNLPKIE